MTFNSQISIIKRNIQDITEYLSQDKQIPQLPLYSSMDIRINSYKSAVIDTNLYPAGFNNLCPENNINIAEIFKKTINQYVPHCKRILLLAECNTRNKFYLDNLLALKHYLNKANFDVEFAAMLTQSQDEHLVKNGILNLTSASNKPITLYDFHYLESELLEKRYDFILLNNDLINGIPEILNTLKTPVYPSYSAGWHSRYKSHHFKEVNRIMTNCAKQFNFDPFYVTTQFKEIKNCTINNEQDRNRLYLEATDLFKTLEEDYKSRGIEQKPFLFLKTDSGSYGMGVHAIESPNDILNLNRKGRNRLAKGKESKIINNLILQEGIASDLIINNQTAELCMYYASKEYLGSFYRLNEEKNNRSNLNSKGMSFQKIIHGDDINTKHPPLKNCVTTNEENFILYQFLSLVSIVAAQQEIIQLEQAIA